MDAIHPLYIFSVLISCAIFVYGYIDSKRSDADFKAFFDETPKDDQ
jgi:hypothetical protein